MAAVNTLAYYNMATNMTLTSFIVQALGSALKDILQPQLLLYLNKLECLTTSTHFHLSLIFAGKVINISL
jgi:hypothetical protein